MRVCDVESCLCFALRWKELTERGLLSESSSIRGGSRLRANDVDLSLPRLLGTAALHRHRVETARGVSALSCHSVTRQTHSLMCWFVPRWGPLDGRNFPPKKPWTCFEDSCWCHGVLASTPWKTWLISLNPSVFTFPSEACLNNLPSPSPRSCLCWLQISGIYLQRCKWWFSEAANILARLSWTAKLTFCQNHHQKIWG